jgi:IS5 family transposase
MRSAWMIGHYTHAHQFKRARRELKFLRTRLGRTIRDIAARSRATRGLKTASARCSIWHCVFAAKSSRAAKSGVSLI